SAGRILVVFMIVDALSKGRARTNGTAQFGTEFFGNRMRVHTVANDLRTDEDDQLRTRLRVVLVRERVADAFDLIEQGNAAAVLVLLVLDQASQQHGLSVGDGNRAFDLPLLDGRGQRRGCI